MSDEITYLFLEPGMDEKIEQHLNKYVISSDIQVNRATHTFAMFGVYGPAWKDAVTFLSFPCPDDESLWCKKSLCESVTVFMFKSRYIGVPGVEILVAKQNA